jgi:glutamate synthase (NADPH/NADH) small chain
VLEIREGDAVTIKQIENSIIDRAWEEGWVVAQPPAVETGASVAVIGAGPAGMAAAQQLRRAGHAVVLFERDEACGGLVRFGVPQFKIEKYVVERRVQQLVEEGVDVRCGVDVGVDVSVDELRSSFDAVVLSTGSRVPRDLPAEGRDELSGIHYAMEYLYERQRAVDAGREHGAICAKDKHVVVIGGGDTGADCVGNAVREGALSVVQLEILPRPADSRPDAKTPWPLWPEKYRLSYAMEEALAAGTGEQDYAVTTRRFVGDGGAVRALEVAEAENFAPKPGTERELPADLVLLAMGFLHPEQELLDGLGVSKDQRGNAAAPVYETSVEGVFAAGDARRGQSLIVWAINEGRQAARMCDRHLRGLAEVAGPDADEGPEGPPQHPTGANALPA